MINSNIFPAFAQNNVPVVVSSNNLFAPYTGVFIQSLLDHASEGNNYDIIILERDISEENKRLLKSLVADYANVSVRFYDPSPLFISFNFVDEKHNWPLEVFYRLVSPHFLNYPGRIISIDVDTLLKTDIARLMDEDLEGCCVGGVSSGEGIYTSCLFDRMLFPSSRNIRARDYWQKICGFEDWKDWECYKDYINGGLVLFDCDKYTQEIDVETILHTAQQYDYLFLEQDVLNILMKGKIKLLDLAWNVKLPANVHMARNLDIKAEIYNKIYNDNDAYRRAHEDPHLLHWTGKPKPWVCPDVPYGNEWWQTALRTPFVGHIIARMVDALDKRRQHYRTKRGKEDVDVWEPSPKGIKRPK